MWDTPSAASTWLKTFAINNEELLKETNVKSFFSENKIFKVFLFSFVQSLPTHGVLVNQHPLVHIFSI